MDLNLTSVISFSHTNFTSKYIQLAQRKHRHFSDWQASSNPMQTINVAEQWLWVRLGADWEFVKIYPNISIISKLS